MGVYGYSRRRVGGDVRQGELGQGELREVGWSRATSRHAEVLCEANFAPCAENKPSEAHLIHPKIPLNLYTSVLIL